MINKLRKLANFPEEEFSDEQVLEMTEGTLLRAFIEAEESLKYFGISIEKGIMRVRKEMKEDFEKHFIRLMRR